MAKKVRFWFFFTLVVENKGGGAELAGGRNKGLFVRPGHIFGWNLMKLGMGPLFDMLYPKKWSNSVRRTVRPAKPEICPAIFFMFFSRFGSFGVIKTEKNGRRFCWPVGPICPADRIWPAAFFSPFGSFGVDLEILNQKVLTKKNLSTEYLTIDDVIMRLILEFF